MKEDTPIIGFDAKRAVANGTGLGSYSRTLINDLARYPLTLRLYAPDEGRDDLRTQIQDRANVTLHTPHSTFHIPHSTSHIPHSTFHIPHSTFHIPHSTSLGKSLWRSHGIVSDLRRDGIQLYHGLSGELPIGIRKSGIPSVVTIHDLIFLRHPEYYHWIDTKIYAWKFRQTISEATHIIAISECTRRDILHYAPELDPARISVIYQSCAPKFTLHTPHSSSPDISPSTFHIPHSTFHIPPSSKYILSVGTIEARKNILLAVKALETSQLPDDLHIVIIGRHTPYTDTVARYARDHGLEAREVSAYPSSRPSAADSPSLPAQAPVLKRRAVLIRSTSPPTTHRPWPQPSHRFSREPQGETSASYAHANTSAASRATMLQAKSTGSTCDY